MAFFELSGSDPSSFLFQDNRYIHNVQILFALRKIDGALTQACPAFLRGVPFHRMDRTAVSSKIGRSGHITPVGTDEGHAIILTGSSSSE